MISDSERFPTVAADQLAWITADQMRVIDRAMVGEMHIGLIQMMENAGRNLALLVLARATPRSVAVHAGPGGNGGGGLVAARHLANAGVDVTILLGETRDRMTPVPARQLDIAEQLGIPVVASDQAAADVQTDVAVDALVGYSLTGDLRGRAAELVETMATRSDAVVSLDVPSGLDSTTGTHGAIVARADATLTLCLPKTGLREAPSVGELFLADISVPPDLAEQVGGSPPPPFGGAPILRVT